MDAGAEKYVFVDSGGSNTQFIESLITNVGLRDASETVPSSIEGGVEARLAAGVSVLIFTSISEMKTAERLAKKRPDLLVILFTASLPNPPPADSLVVYIHKNVAVERLAEELAMENACGGQCGECHAAKRGRDAEPVSAT